MGYVDGPLIRFKRPQAIMTFIVDVPEFDMTRDSACKVLGGAVGVAISRRLLVCIGWAE